MLTINVLIRLMCLSTAVDCGKPPSLVNATVTFNETTFGESAYYTCDTGLWLSSGKRRTVIRCMDSGNWTNTDNTCRGLSFHSYH